VRAGSGPWANAPRGLAAADRLRGLAVVAPWLAPDAGAGRARAVLVAVLLVRATVDRLRASVPRRDPRLRVQRPARLGSVHHRARSRARYRDDPDTGAGRRGGGDRMDARGPRQVDAGARRRRARMVGRGGRD